MRHLLLALVVLGTVSAQAADPFAAFQWGLSNQGQPQVVDLDPLFTYKVPGRAHEDVNLPTRVKALKKFLWPF